MRIVQLTRDFPPSTSGIGDHVARTSAALVAGGDEVVVVCAKPAGPADGVDLRAVDAPWDGSGVDAIAEAVRNAEPDAIVWHYNPFQIGRRGLAGPAGRLAHALSRIAPLTVVAHELWYPWGRSGLRGLVWAIAQRRRFRAVASRARAVVVTTHARRVRVARFHPNVFVVAAGATVEPDPHAMARAAVRASLGIPADSFVVAHLGAIGEGRDLAPAIRALASLRRDGLDARLLLAGRTGVEPPRADGIHATGARSHSHLSAALSACDAYLFAEPTGPVARKTSLLSALAHRLPVIAYAGKDGEAEFRDEDTVLLVEPSAGAIAHAVRRLAGDPALRERLAASGARLAAERFSWTTIARHIRAAAAGAEAAPARPAPTG